MSIQGENESFNNWLSADFARGRKLFIVAVLAIRLSFVLHKNLVAKTLLTIFTNKTLGMPFLAHCFRAKVQHRLRTLRTTRTEILLVTSITIRLFIPSNERTSSYFTLTNCAKKSAQGDNSFLEREQFLPLFLGRKLCMYPSI